MNLLSYMVALKIIYFHNLMPHNRFVSVCNLSSLLLFSYRFYRTYLGSIHLLLPTVPLLSV
jgi:hypothetical protein